MSLQVPWVKLLDKAMNFYFLTYHYIIIKLDTGMCQCVIHRQLYVSIFHWFYISRYDELKLTVHYFCPFNDYLTGSYLVGPNLGAGGHYSPY